LAEAYLKQGQTAASEFCACVAYALGDRRPAILGLLVGKMLRGGCFQEAQELVTIAKELHPAGTGVRLCLEAAPGLEYDAQAVMFLSQILQANGAGEAASSLICRALAHFPGNEDLLVFQGQLHFEAGHDQEAFDKLQGVAEQNPSRTDALLLLALLCLRNRQFALAADFATAVAQQDRVRAPQAWLVVSDAYRFAGQSETALAALEAAASLAPSEGQIAKEIQLRMSQMKKS
jgi:tetratricopeptide (TPR) repeat protein